MRVVLLGRYHVAHPFSRHTLDYPMLKEWAARMENLDLIVQGTEGGSRTWREGNLVVHYAPMTATTRSAVGFGAWACYRIICLARRGPVDIVDGSDLWGSLIGIAVRPVLGVKVLAQLQGEFLPPSRFSYSAFKRPLLHVLARFVCRRADLVRCLYQAAAAQVEAIGVPPTRIAVVPSRCDPKLFDPARFSPRVGMKERLLCVGNLIRGKGVVFLLSAFAKLLPSHPDATLTVVGDGPDRVTLQRLTARLGLRDRVAFLGRQPHGELPSLMRQADLFVCPSLSEATPRVVLEAMAMQLPVVATDVGGLPEVVEEGRTGFLVPPANACKMAAAVSRALTDLAWARRAGRLARERIMSRYTLERHVREMVALHYRLAGGAEAEQ